MKINAHQNSTRMENSSRLCGKVWIDESLGKETLIVEIQPGRTVVPNVWSVVGEEPSMISGRFGNTNTSLSRSTGLFSGMPRNGVNGPWDGVQTRSCLKKMRFSNNP